MRGINKMNKKRLKNRMLIKQELEKQIVNDESKRRVETAAKMDVNYMIFYQRI